jgi:outer membrane protein TolC
MSAFKVLTKDGMQRLILSLLIICSLALSLVQAQPLSYFLEKGLVNSPLLKAYQNQISSATLDSMKVNASQQPQIGANAQLLYAPVWKNFGYDEAISNGGNYMATVGASQFILNHKSLNNKFENIDLQRRSVLNTSRISTQELKRTITNQYLLSFADFSSLSFNKSFNKLIEEEKNILIQLIEGGIYKQTDYLSLLIEAQSLEILIQQLSDQYKTDIRVLNQLCGLNDTSTYNLVLPYLEQFDHNDLSTSPLFMQFKIDSLKIVNEKSAVDISYHPKLNWFADAGFVSSVPYYLQRHLGYSAGLNFSVPIYDGKQRKIDYQKLALDENTRSNYAYFFKNQYQQQIEQLKSKLKSNKDIVDRYKRQLESSEELNRLAKALLNKGNISITEFINAMRNYININNNLNQAQIQSLQIINEINYLMQK